MTNVLLITDELKYVCGISKHIKLLVNGFYECRKEFNIILLCGRTESSELKDEYKCKVVVCDTILHSKRNPVNFLKSVLLINTLIRKHNINIVHSHNHYVSNTAYYAAKMTKTKTIQTNHGLLSENGRLSHFRADYFVVLSERIKNYLLSTKKVNIDRIFQINPGIENPEEPLLRNILTPEKIIFAASRYVKEKGLNLYIKAANNLNNVHPNKYKFYISGTGEEYDNLLLLNISLGNCVKFIDPMREFSEVFEKSDIFVYTSLSDSEGIPAVILEAIMKNCLVISSDYTGYKDIFPNEYSALIYKSGNQEDLVNKIEEAANSYSSLLEYYLPLYDKIKSEYSMDNMIYNYINLYNKIAPC